MQRDSDWVDPYYTQQYSSNTAPYQGPYNSGQNLQYRAPYNQPPSTNQYPFASGPAAVSSSNAYPPAKRDELQRGATMRTFITEGGTKPPSYQSRESDSTIVGHTRSDSTISMAKLHDKEKRGAGCFRYMGCGILTFLYLVICTFLTLALYVRPPSLTVGQMGIDTTLPGGPVGPGPNGGISLFLAMNFSVVNPNYFSVNFKKISADIRYPTNSTLIGQGNVTDVVFESHSSKELKFPLTITYSSALDPGDKIKNDLQARCADGRQITVDATLTLGIRILVITISPSFDRSFSFSCPSELAKLLGN